MLPGDGITDQEGTGHEGGEMCWSAGLTSCKSVIITSDTSFVLSGIKCLSVSTL